MGEGPVPVYPATTGVQMSSAPPPYPGTVGAAPVAVEMQPVYVQSAYVATAPPQVVHTHVVQPQQTTTTTTVIVSSHCKRVQNDHPYLEYCPRCQTSVTTRTVYSIGACWWFICFVGCFLFCWPILFCLLCANSKDVKHFCPNCGTMLAIKKRGC
uniref:LITAF domain-containing protein n=1 Tax=Caenorhabditis tropicalis TaxID=1561998 RepID=A0A1I7UK48_9PELO